MTAHFVQWEYTREDGAYVGDSSELTRLDRAANLFDLLRESPRVRFAELCASDGKIVQYFVRPGLHNFYELRVLYARYDNAREVF